MTERLQEQEPASEPLAQSPPPAGLVGGGPAERMLALRRTAGNAAVARLVRRGPLGREPGAARLLARAPSTEIGTTWFEIDQRRRAEQEAAETGAGRQTTLVRIAAMTDQEARRQAPGIALRAQDRGDAELARELFGRRSCVIVERLGARNDAGAREIRYLVLPLGLTINPPSAAPDPGGVVGIADVEMLVGPPAPGYLFVCVTAGPWIFFRPTMRERIAQLDAAEQAELAAGFEPPVLDAAARREAVFGPIDRLIEAGEDQDAADQLLTIDAQGFALVHVAAKVRYVTALLRAFTYEPHGAPWSRCSARWATTTRCARCSSASTARGCSIVISRLPRTAKTRALRARIDDVYAILRDARTTEDAIVELWEEATRRGMTPRDVLLEKVGAPPGGGGREIVAYKVRISDDGRTTGILDVLEDDEFRMAMREDAPMRDLEFGEDYHGAYTHMFQESLIDHAIGQGEGRRSRQWLADLKDLPAVPGSKGPREFFAATWDALFDIRPYARTHDASADGQHPHRCRGPRGRQSVLRRTRYGAGR